MTPWERPSTCSPTPRRVERFGHVERHSEPLKVHRDPGFRAWLLPDERPAPDAEDDAAPTVQASLGAAVEFDDVGAKGDTPTDAAEFSARAEVLLMVGVWLLQLGDDLLQTSRQKPCDYPLGWPEGPGFRCRDRRDLRLSGSRGVGALSR